MGDVNRKHDVNMDGELAACFLTEHTYFTNILSELCRITTVGSETMRAA